MPAGSKPGERRGGRQKGSQNKATRALEHRGDPLVLLSSLRIKEILTGKLPCTLCRGSRKTQYRLPDGSHSRTCAAPVNRCTCNGVSTRPCQSCNETGLEPIPPELIGKVALAVREEAYPKLKAVEHSNPDGMLRPSWVVVGPGETPK